MDTAMTDQDWIDLGKRAVACEGWRWLPGMLVMSDPDAVPRAVQMPVPAPSALRARVYAAQLGTWYGVGEYDVDAPDWEGKQCRGGDLPGTLPDLTDPATLGCLLALVREALGKPHSHLVYDYDHWSHPWALWHSSGWLHEPTEAAALISALEAAAVLAQLSGGVMTNNNL
jgi:hypothetical protein